MTDYFSMLPLELQEQIMKDKMILEKRDNIIEELTNGYMGIYKINILYSNYDKIVHKFGYDELAEKWYGTIGMQTINETNNEHLFTEKLSKILNNKTQEYLFTSITQQTADEVQSYWDDIWMPYEEDEDDEDEDEDDMI